MIFLILAVVGLTVMGLGRIQKALWSILDVAHSAYKKVTSK